MNPLRRAVLRSALTVSNVKTVASKPSTPFFALRTSTIARISPARSFTQSQLLRSETDSEVAKAADPATEIPEAPKAPAPVGVDVQEASQEVSKSRPSPDETNPVPEHERSVFLRNFVWDVTEENLAELTDKFGTIESTFIVRDPRGISKGYGFVVFKEKEAAQAAIDNLNTMFWHGRRLTVQPRDAVQHRDRKGTRPSKLTPEAAKLYIGNIPFDTSDQELNAMFRSMDGVVNVRVAVDRNTGFPKGFMHIDFSSVETAKAAHDRLQGVRLGDRQLVVDYATGFTVASNRRRRQATTNDENGL